MLVQLLSVASDFMNTAVWCKMQTITIPKGGQGIHSDVSPLAVTVELRVSAGYYFLFALNSVLIICFCVLQLSFL